MTSVLDFYGGTVTFTSPLEHLKIGQGWATWSNGYTGDVYRQNTRGLGPGDDSLYTATLTLPFPRAFYLYVEGNAFSATQFNVTATATNGSKAGGSQMVTGLAGARFFGFYTSSGSAIASVTVTSRNFPFTQVFSIGELGDGFSCQ